MRPGCPPSLVRLHRIVGCALLLAVAVAACVPAQADDAVGAFRHGKHASRKIEQVPAVGTTHFVRAGASSHRRAASRAWFARSLHPIAPARPVLARAGILSVHTLPGDWGSRHLII